MERKRKKISPGGIFFHLAGFSGRFFIFLILEQEREYFFQSFEELSLFLHIIPHCAVQHEHHIVPVGCDRLFRRERVEVGVDEKSVGRIH